MSYASRSGRARTSSRNPQAFAVCQRCSIWRNHADLSWQYQWAGAGLQNIRLLVCNECLDTPQDQLRSLVLPPDPLPILYALPEPFDADETGNVPVYGRPVGLEQPAIPPQFGTTHYGVQLPVLSVTSAGSNAITVTCSEPHGLSTDAQVSVEGLTSALAAGFFSIEVTTATAFTYTTFSTVPAGSMNTPTTRIVTVLVGLPRGVTTIPQIAP